MKYLFLVLLSFNVFGYDEDLDTYDYDLDAAELGVFSPNDNASIDDCEVQGCEVTFHGDKDFACDCSLRAEQ